MKFVVVDIQGFVICSKFVPKEMCIYTGSQQVTFLFQPPVPYNSLSDEEKKTARYLETCYHGLRYSDGFVMCGEIQKIFDTYFNDVDVVYVKGKVKADFIRDSLTLYRAPLIVNLENVENVSKLELDTPMCMNHKYLNKCMCALRNCYILYNFIVNLLPY